MRDIYTPTIRAFVVAGLFLATATLMFVAVNTARATGSGHVVVQTLKPVS